MVKLVREQQVIKHLLSKKVDRKSNEITSITKLIKKNFVKGANAEPQASKARRK